jgi:hypothetical protein
MMEWIFLPLLVIFIIFFIVLLFNCDQKERKEYLSGLVFILGCILLILFFVELICH